MTEDMEAIAEMVRPLRDRAAIHLANIVNRRGGVSVVTGINGLESPDQEAIDREFGTSNRDPDPWVQSAIEEAGRTLTIPEEANGPQRE